MQLCIQHNKTVFFNIIDIHIVIIFEKMSRIDEEQAVFEQLSLSNFKMRSSTALTQH